MIGFLAPAYLLAAAAAAIPLLIHLMRRRIGKRIEFPAVRYLARAEREHSRKLRLRNVLLMLLRVAAVLLIVGAAARPVARVVGSGHAPTTLVIVLDNSLSTSAVVGGKTVLDELKARATDVARRASGEDRLFLLTLDGAVRGGSRGAVLDAIGRVEPLGGAGSMSRTLARAAGLVRAGTFVEREIAVLTDAQATSWTDAPQLGDVRVVAYRPKGAPPRNHAVIEAAATPVMWTPRGSVSARVLTTDSATYRLLLGGRTLARGSVTKDDAILVRAAPPERGWTAGSVELEPDELRGDDVRYFAVWVGPAPAVAVNPAAGIFTLNAVDALVQADRIGVGSDIAIGPAEDIAKLPALLIAPSDPVHLGAANRALERLSIPWRFGVLRRGESVVRGERGSASAATTAALAGVMVSQRFALMAASGGTSDTLATAGGEPWIVSGPRYVVVASPLLPEATTLPVRAGFLPWLSETISQRLGGDAGAVLNAAPGALVAPPAGADGIELAAGQRSPVTGDTLTAPPRAGVYFFTRGERRTGALVVNPEPEESRLDRLGSDTLRSRIRASSVRVTDDPARWAGALFASAPRRPLVAPLLVCALAALLAEAAIAGATRGRTL